MNNQKKLVALAISMIGCSAVHASMDLKLDYHLSVPAQASAHEPQDKNLEQASHGLARFVGASESKVDAPKADIYSQAITLNKEGKGKEALALLYGLMRREPAVARYKQDYIAVASASGLHKEALSYIDGTFEKTAARYVMEAMFRSAVASNETGKVIYLGSVMADRYGKEVWVEVRVINALLEEKRNEAALNSSKALFEANQDNVDAWDVYAYVLRRLGYRDEALLTYEKMAERFPENKNAPKAVSMILLDFGVPHQADRLAIGNRVALSDPEIRKIAIDRGVHYLRWSPGDFDTPGERFKHADLSIATLQNALNLAVSQNAPKQQVDGIRLDMTVAYRTRREWKKAVDLYEQLQSEGVVAPAYARLAVASCYQALRKFETAESMFRVLAGEKPDSYEIQIGWYFVLADLERYDEAKVVIDQLVAALNKANKVSRDKSSAYTSALVSQAMLEAYQDRLGEAEKGIRLVLSEAPSSIDAIESSGTLAAWRGHPREAEDQFRIILGEFPDRVEPKLGVANARMDRGDSRFFRQTLRELENEYPDVRSVIDAKRREVLFDKNYVVANFAFGNGNDGTANNSDWTGDVRIYSSPLYNDSVRGFVRYRGLNSGPAVDTRSSEYGAGIKLMGVDKYAEIEVGTNSYARIEGNYSFDDKISIGGIFENNSNFIPPKAIRANVSGDIFGVSLKYRENESIEFSVAHKETKFTDGNDKAETSIYSNARVFTRYNQRLSLSGWASYQTNSDPRVAYFAPKAQSELSGTVTYEFLQWRDIETKKYSLWHKLWASYGIVGQNGFSSMPMNNYGYGQDISLGDAVKFKWGIGRTTFPFDGVRSSYYTGYAGFEGYF